MTDKPTSEELRNVTSNTQLADELAALAKVAGDYRYSNDMVGIKARATNLPAIATALRNPAPLPAEVGEVINLLDGLVTCGCEDEALHEAKTKATTLLQSLSTQLAAAEAKAQEQAAQIASLTYERDRNQASRQHHIRQREKAAAEIVALKEEVASLTARENGLREEEWKRGYCAGSSRTALWPPKGEELGKLWAAEANRRFRLTLKDKDNGK